MKGHGAFMTAEEWLARGIVLLGEGNSLGALACFEKSYSMKSGPAVGSYLGLCIARERGMVTEAVRLCSGAIEQDPSNPDFYLNLATVYIRIGRKEDALDVLRRGAANGDDARIRTLLDELGARKRPAFPFLPRKHFLNRYLGIVLRRLRLR